jgi:hypothetical protein
MPINERRKPSITKKGDIMIRLNVRKDGKVEVKSFINKKDLENYVLDFIGCDQYNIAMAGKSRAGNIMLGGE